MHVARNYIDIRGLRYHVQEWGDRANPTLFMVHGWMDCGASFKFMAPYLIERFHIVAPDLRGFGDTEHAPGGYWFPDYYADLDALLNHYSPDQKANLVGHSMGGNIVMMYAGIQPERVARVLSLDSVGIRPTSSADTPERYRQWLGETLSSEPAKVYPNVETLKQSIRKGNPSFSEDIVDEVVELWAKHVGDNGKMMLKHDHSHRYINPVRYNFDEVIEVWKQVTARAGLVMAEKTPLSQFVDVEQRVGQMRELLGIVDKDYFLIEDAHHMLHMERPQDTAECIQQFFA